MADSQPSRRNSKDHPIVFFELRLVLVGRTGAGKSSCGNTILGENAFSASVSASSVTRQCSKRSGCVGGQRLTLVDTPGLFDTSLNEDDEAREVSKCVNMSCPGPHAILLVLRVGRFTPEEQGAVGRLERIFGPGAWRYTVVLFTHVDPGSLRQALADPGPELQEVLRRVQNRYHALDNERADDRAQVLQLLEKVKRMVQENGEEFYSNPTYVEMSRLLDEREKELRVRYAAEFEEKLSAVKQKYQDELNKVRNDVNQHKQLERSREVELEELRRFYEAVQGQSRRVVEEMTQKDTLDNANYHRNLSFCLK